MTERFGERAPQEGDAPRCIAGSSTDNPCPRPATVPLFGGEAPRVCAYHDRLWRLNEEEGQLEVAARWLALWQEQAEMLGCPPLEDAVRFVRAEAEAEAARVKREAAALEGSADAPCPGAR